MHSLGYVAAAAAAPSAPDSREGGQEKASSKCSTVVKCVLIWRWQLHIVSVPRHGLQSQSAWPRGAGRTPGAAQLRNALPALFTTSLLASFFSPSKIRLVH